VYETKIAGIPALIKVLSFYPGQSGVYDGHPDFRCPPEDPEVEYQVCSTSGHLAPWLERKLTEKDKQQLEQDLIKWILKQREEVY